MIKKTTSERICGNTYRRKKVVLVISSYELMSKFDLVSYLQINMNVTIVKYLKTELKGETLKRRVKEYMKEKQISIAKGDEVIYMKERMEGGMPMIVRNKKNTL